MADETTNEVAEVEETHVEETPGIDWKGESRKWEKRAKENAKAAEELAALKESQMTEQQKLEARAAEAEAKLAALEAEKQRTDDAQAVAKETGVPLDLLLYCADKDAMEAFAAKYAADKPEIHSAPSAPNVRLVKGADGKVSTRDTFAQLFKDMI